MGIRPRHADLPGESSLRPTRAAAPRRAAEAAADVTVQSWGAPRRPRARVRVRRALVPLAVGGLAVSALVTVPQGSVLADATTATLTASAPRADSGPGSPAATSTAVPVPVVTKAQGAVLTPEPPAVWVSPNAGHLTSHYGPRWGRVHAGLDLASPIGTPIVAAGDGVVVFAGATPGYGNLVMVQHEGGDVTAYGHMSEILVAQDQVVTGGQEIAKVGNEGASTGPHLHFEVRVGGPDGPKIDPEPWLADRGVVLDPEHLAAVAAAVAEQQAAAAPAS